MKKLFYTCPIKALWMMKEFGLIVEHPKHIGDTECYKSYPSASLCLSDLEYFLCKEGKIYVAEESLPIFEPRDFDLIHCKKYGIWMFGYDDKVETITKDKFVEWIGINEIIVRDNKHFFQPEVEK